MAPPKPELVILYGANSSLISPLIDDSRFESADFIRVFNRSMAPPSDQCTDLVSLDALSNHLDTLKVKAHYRSIIFVGAAFLSQNKLFVAEGKDDIEGQLQTNVLNYVDCTHMLLRHMISVRSGCFVYLSSFRGEIGTRGTSLYSASKAFGEAFFSIIGQENAAFGIHTVSIRMGYFDGRMTDLLPQDKVDQLRLNIGSRRLGQAQDLCSAIKFAVDNPYLNGGVIDLNGGLSFP